VWNPGACFVLFKAGNQSCLNGIYQINKGFCGVRLHPYRRVAGIEGRRFSGKPGKPTAAAYRMIKPKKT
jgi:hypothetical protein